MSVPLYPNVPALPGVPALLRSGTSFLPLPILALADMLGLQALIGGPPWGIFDQGGSPVLAVDTVLELSFQQDYAISDFPVEGGGFATYNKVTRPFRSRVDVAIGGLPQKRSAFLATLAQIAGSLTLYTVVMPEFSYPSANIVHYDFDRSQRSGANMLRVSIWVEEVRQIATAAFSNTQSPNGAAEANGGTVQPAPVTVTQLPPVTAAGAH